MKKCFQVLFHVMITNEVSATILQAYISLLRHIRKGMVIRWIITSHLCAAVGCQQFFKYTQKNFKGKLCLNAITPFIIVVALQFRDVPKIVI